LAGTAVAGLAGLGVIALGEEVGWWRLAISWEPYFLTLMCIDITLCAFVFLITWRIARRFGWRGLAVVLVIAAVLGPVRNYQYLEWFPEWGAYAPGLAPFLAISATYVRGVVPGHRPSPGASGPRSGNRTGKKGSRVRPAVWHLPQHAGRGEVIVQALVLRRVAVQEGGVIAQWRVGKLLIDALNRDTPMAGADAFRHRRGKLKLLARFKFDFVSKFDWSHDHTPEYFAATVINMTAAPANLVRGNNHSLHHQNNTGKLRLDTKLVNC
jgi:hypothetical protein